MQAAERGDNQARFGATRVTMSKRFFRWFTSSAPWSYPVRVLIALLLSVALPGTLSTNSYWLSAAIGVSLGIVSGLPELLGIRRNVRHVRALRRRPRITYEFSVVGVDEFKECLARIKREASADPVTCAKCGDVVPWDGPVEVREGAPEAAEGEAFDVGCAP